MGWIVFVYRLPAQPSRHRVGVWRELRRIGALPIQQSIYILPEGKENLEALARVASSVEGVGGESYLLKAAPLDQGTASRLEAAQLQAVEEEYQEFLSECSKFRQEIRKEIRIKKFTRAELAQFAEILKKLRAEFPGSYKAHVLQSAGTLAFADWIASESADAPVAATTADDVCFWLYSSGSTGSPKGAVHLHADLIQTAELYARPVLGIAPDDVVFSAAKLFFAYGLGNALTFPLSVGATSVLMAERPTPAAVFKRLVGERPTIFYGVPTLYAAMLASTEFPARDRLGAEDPIRADS